MNYIVITPVKDEERFIEQTIQSMIVQTIKPQLWIIVDDGSLDNTRAIVKRYLPDHSFIVLAENKNTGKRLTGSAEIVAFNFGFEMVKDVPFDVIVKLDGDLRFEGDYFAKLLREFDADSRLGITSGVYYELNAVKKWVEVKMPAYHAAGASKIVRKECWKDIGGFISHMGWDTLDEIRAMAKGWRTRHFHEAKMQHLKPEGSGMGLIRTAIMQGKIYYLTGGDFLFFCLKIISRLKNRPVLIGAVAMFGGYMSKCISGAPILVTAKEKAHYRSILRKRLLFGFCGKSH